MRQVARSVPCGEKWIVTPKNDLRTWNEIHKRGERGRTSGAGGIVILTLQFVEHAVGRQSRQLFGKESCDAVRQEGHRSPTVRKNKLEIRKPGESPIHEEAVYRSGRVG